VIFVRQLRAEWTKFRSVRAWVLAVVGAAVVTAALGPLNLSAERAPSGGTGPALVRGPDGQAVNDSFYFVRRQLAGDGTITARITDLTGITTTGPNQVSAQAQGWAKAGIIVKQSLIPGSPYAAIMLTGAHGCSRSSVPGRLHARHGRIRDRRAVAASDADRRRRQW
jgi:hypothetical protein